MPDIPIPDPAGEGFPAALAAKPAPAPAAAPAPAKEPRRVLLADHHIEFTRQLKGILEKAGCKVEVRSDAVSGGAGVNAFKPEAAVVDLDLPAGGGKIVYRVLRTNALSRDIPVLLLAAPGERAIWTELGCSPHPKTLVIRRALDMRLLLPALKALLGLS